MIYISYGVTKSASTFIYQLVEEIFRMSGRQPAKLSTTLKGRPHVENYVEPISGEILDRVRKEVRGQDVVIKTHGAPDNVILAQVASGHVLASAIIRDPREIALSMVDHGERARALGVKDFTDFTEPRLAIENLKRQIERFNRWTSCKAVLVFAYDQISFETTKAVQILAAQIGVDVNPEVVIAPFAAKKSKIGQFNKGQRNRYLELPLEDQRAFETAFPQLYKNGRFFCDKLVSLGV
jgi:hypothetical protein